MESYHTAILGHIFLVFFLEVKLSYSKHRWSNFEAQCGGDGGSGGSGEGSDGGDDIMVMINGMQEFNTNTYNRREYFPWKFALMYK